MLALQTLWIQTFLSAGLSTCINHNETAVTGQVSSDCTAHTDEREQSDIKITRFTQKHPVTTVSRNTVYKKFNVPEKCNRNISHFSKSLMKWAWDILGGLVKYLMWDVRTGLELEWNFRHYKAVLLYALQSISFLILSLSFKHIHRKSGEHGLSCTVTKVTNTNCNAASDTGFLLNEIYEHSHTIASKFMPLKLIN